MATRYRPFQIKARTTLCSMLFSTGQAQLDLHVHMGARGYEIGAMCLHTQEMEALQSRWASCSSPRASQSIMRDPRHAKACCVLVVGGSPTEHSAVYATWTGLHRPFHEGYRDLPEQPTKMSNSYIFTLHFSSRQSQWLGKDHHALLFEFA